jgi:phosphoglycerate kinase
MKLPKSIETIDVDGKRVIVRVDWNVTLGKALQIVDDTRIVRTLPTIKWLLDHDAKRVILMSHLGKAEEKRSLKPVVAYAEKLLSEEIVLCATVLQCHSTTDRIVMLDNLRFWEGEEANDPTFSKQLASLGDIYVNEAFGESHRSAASIVGIPQYVPHYAGLWLAEEVETILKIRDSAEHPFVLVMGGAKVQDKSKLLEVLSQRADTILLGGKLANEYVQKGMRASGKAKVLTPIEGIELQDIGLETQKLYAAEIAKAKTVIWNGPMGKVEEVQYRSGTRAIFDALVANESAYTLVGGGDTLAAISDEAHLTRIDHVSTGGGAMLSLLERGVLPGISVLES